MPRDSVLDALSVRPEIARTLADHLDIVLRGGSVPELTKVLCAAMVSAVDFCQPSVVEYRRRAAELGVDADTLNALWDYARSERFTGAQKAALAAAVALTREPRALPPAVRADLETHYDAGEISEILCAIGAFNYLNRVSNALQTQIVR
jgi:alkylhydroperoxidase family enzyme